MKRALIVAYYFPPLSTSGCLRPMAFCKYLPQYGWEPSVLTVVPDTADPELARDPSLLNGHMSRLQIHSAPDENMLVRIGRARRAAFASRIAAENQSPAVSTPDEQPSFVRRSVGAGLRMLFAFPDNCAGWFRPGVREGLRMVTELKPDVVLATAPPWTGLLVGATLARRAGVPLVADFRDPWTASRKRYADQPGGSTRADRLERRTIRDAARVIANTAEAAAWLKSKYPVDAAKIVAIPNGYDPDLMPALDNARDTNPVRGPLELCHFGTVYRARSPRQLLLALSDLATANPDAPPALRVRFIGAWQVTDPETMAIVERLERSGIMTREAPLPHAACLQAMRSSRALLILQPDLPLQIPGKLYEYIAVGRPLVVAGGEGATASLVTRERLGVCCADERNAIRELFDALAKGTRRFSEPDPSARDRFQYPSLAGVLASTLDEATAK
jgi:glycosyltransferase involved in cell wall biosynthesis